MNLNLSVDDKRHYCSYLLHLHLGDIQHVVSAAIEAMDKDDLVLGLLLGDAGFQVRQVPAVPEPRSGRRDRRPARRAGDLGRRRLDLAVQQRREEHEQSERQRPECACEARAAVSKGLFG